MIYLFYPFVFLLSTFILSLFVFLFFSIFSISITFSLSIYLVLFHASLFPPLFLLLLIVMTERNGTGGLVPKLLLFSRRYTFVPLMDRYLLLRVFAISIYTHTRGSIRKLFGSAGSRNEQRKILDRATECRTSTKTVIEPVLCLNRIALFSMTSTYIPDHKSPNT